jgi:site-specific DNA recombinase
MPSRRVSGGEGLAEGDPWAPRDPLVAFARLQDRLHPSESMSYDPHHPDLACIAIAIRLKRRGQRTSIATPDGRPLARRRRCDQALVRGLRSAHSLAQALHAQPAAPVDTLLATERAESNYQRRLIQLAYLAPDIQQAILQGDQPAGLNLERLMQSDVPLVWADQRAAFGFVALR